MDRREEAEAQLRAAYELANRITYPPVIWRSTSLLAEVARRAGDSGRAESLAVEARSRVEGVSRSLADAELRSGLASLGERLVSDPISAFR